MIFTMLPKAAELDRAQVDAGLDGDPKAAAKARVFFRFSRDDPAGFRDGGRPGRPLES